MTAGGIGVIQLLLYGVRLPPPVPRIHGATSSAGSGRRKASWAGVSTPSATALMSSPPAMAITALVMAQSLRSSGMLRTNERSTLR